MKASILLPIFSLLLGVPNLRPPVLNPFAISIFF
jgi:hypothetical protein